MTQIAGRVAGLWRHPVKSMQGERLETAQLEQAGVPGDRRHGVVDAATGKVLSAKREPRLLEATARLDGDRLVVRLPGGDERDDLGSRLDADLSDWLERPVRLESAAAERPTQFEMRIDSEDESSTLVDLPCPPGTFFDLAPVHVLTTASLATMADRYPGGEWDVARFRPTLLIETEGQEFVEDAWIGGELRIGGAVLSPFMPTIRCVMTSKAQQGLGADVGIPKAVNAHHQGSLGIYATVASPGAVAVGDELTLG
ncbi:MAG TPA: MOSC N-terminal beta barrel domain-containing protein [Acidimicrobiales bacterium]|nr:MOSC N-terminal beta barrel domain-containing protein [Acidimicrobiales bacterium]